MDHYYDKTDQLHSLVQSLAEKLRLQMEDTKSTNGQLQTANAELKAEIGDLKGINQSLQRDMEQQSRDCSLRLQKQSANHQRLYRQLLAKITAANKAKQSMLQIHESEIRKMRQAYTEEIDYLRTQMDETKRDHQTMRAEKKALEAQLIGIEYDNDMLSSELGKARAALKKHISESASATNAANRKMQHLTRTQSQMMSSMKNLQSMKGRFNHLTQAIDALLSLSKKDMIEEFDVSPARCKDHMQSRLIALQQLSKRIANLHQSRQILKEKLKRVDRFWRGRANEWNHQIADLERRELSMKEDLVMLGWSNKDTKADVERKAESMRGIAVELRCVQLQQHVEVMRASIERKDSEISKLQANLRKSEHDKAETRRIHCAGISLLSNQLIMMRGPLSPESMLIDELQKLPHHSHFEWRELPPPEVDLKKVMAERIGDQWQNRVICLDNEEAEMQAMDEDEETSNGEEATLTVAQKQKGYDHLKLEITSSCGELAIERV